MVTQSGGACATAAPPPQSREIRVVLLAASIDELGGVQRVIKDLAQSFLHRGLCVELISVWETDTAVALDGYPDFPHRSLLRLNWFESLVSERVWEKIGLRATRRKRIDLISWSVAGTRLRRWLHSPNGTVVIAMDVVAANLVASSKLSSSIKIVQYHNSFHSLAKGRDLSRLRKATASFDALVALTEQDANEFSDASFPVPVVTHIPNSIEVDDQFPCQTREKVVLAAGRYHPQKSFDLLLHAWYRVPLAVRHGWKLHLMGEGPEKRRLLQLCENLFPDSNDVLIGERGDVRRELRGASVFALSSQYEGFPMVLLEALAAGTPVIATDCAPGVREILDNGTAGILVPVAEYVPFAAGLERLLTDSDLRRSLSEAGLNHVSGYSPHRVADEWLKLIDFLATRKNSVGVAAPIRRR